MGTAADCEGDRRKPIDDIVLYACLLYTSDAADE